MAQANKAAPEIPSQAELAADARTLVRRALKASLATIDTATGYPYASLITLATDPSGAPIFLISGLARHTRNLAKDARASILVDGTGASGDPLQGGRVTLIGMAAKTGEAATRRRFLARHLEASVYADFSDFSFWRLVVEGAHYIGGFGRIVDLKPDELLIETSGAEALLAAEADIVQHMNADHADAIQLYATALMGAPAGAWRMSGIDPEGCDIIFDGKAMRIAFASRIVSPDQARNELVRLTAEARAAAENP
jgi:putative heme iron utilization protein